MNTYTFTLLFTGPDAAEYADELYEAGFDDALFGVQHGVQFAEFDREARSLSHALASALRPLEQTIPGAEVVHVLPGDLVGVRGIAERINRTPESVRLLINGERGPGGFPPPITDLDDRPIYAWSQVVRWFAEHKPAEVNEDMVAQASLLAAINHALARRQYERHEHGVERRHADEASELVGA